ncbi:class I SAM-dependent methyltransferase [Sorangium sp. So ce269]
MPAQYDALADIYSLANDLPYRSHVERYTYWELLGSVDGKSVLDVACGDGMYCRLLAQRGARVVGVDVSEAMIRAARRIEGQAPLGIDYRVCDASRLDALGAFDLVTAMYLLHYAPTRDDVRRMCQGLHANLKPGGRLLTFVLNPDFDPRRSNATKYGFTMHMPEGHKEGAPVSADLHVDPPFSIHCYYWSRATYEQALEEAGFKRILWTMPACSPEGEAKYGKAFWRDHLENPHAVFVSCDA